jgi:hypothetical protein
LLSINKFSNNYENDEEDLLTGNLKKDEEFTISNLVTKGSNKFN